MQLLANKATLGEMGTVPITLLGRPGKVMAQGVTVMTTLQGGDELLAPFKEVPTPPRAKLAYLVYIAETQWRKVAEVIPDPEDI